MAINKIEYNGEVLIDLTEDTVTPETLAEGTTAHNSSGELITGRALFGEKEIFYVRGILGNGTILGLTPTFQEIYDAVSSGNKFALFSHSIGSYIEGAVFPMTFVSEDVIVFEGVREFEEVPYQVRVEIFPDDTSKVTITENTDICYVSCTGISDDNIFTVDKTGEDISNAIEERKSIVLLIPIGESALLLPLTFISDEMMIFNSILKEDENITLVSAEMPFEGDNKLTITDLSSQSGGNTQIPSPFIIKAYADFSSYQLTNITDKAGNSITFSEIEEAYNRGDHIIIDINIDALASGQRLLANLTVFKSRVVAVFDQTMENVTGEVIFIRGFIYWDNTTSFTLEELAKQSQLQSQLGGLTLRTSSSTPTVDDRSVVTFVVRG